MCKADGERKKKIFKQRCRVLKRKKPMSNEKKKLISSDKNKK
jgi:hypothetical protein